MLTYTGHALVDVGIAALTALARRDHPGELTADDLERAADRLEALYTRPGPMRNLARGMVFHNAGYTSSPDAQKQRVYADRVLRSWRPGASTLAGESCLFCGRPAAYRASRQEVPLLNGLAVFNFSPAGRAGIPICGLCSLAFQALPLGCVKSGGGLIAAHSSDERLTFQLAREAVRRMEKALSLPEAEGIPDYRYERTRLVEMLISWLASVERASRQTGEAPSMTGYVFTNAGQAPKIRLYPFSSAVVSFLRRVMNAPDGTLTEAWCRAVASAWVPAAGVDDPAMQRNRLYEAIVSLPDNARWVLRKHLFPTRHWGLVVLFLTKVMAMEPERIALLRRIAERLAGYIRERRAFFFQFSRTNEFSKWRRLLLRAADDHMRQTGQPLITFDEFVQVFTAPPGEINDWRLARDLITLALIEMRAVTVVDDEPLFEEEPEDSDEESER